MRKAESGNGSLLHLSIKQTYCCLSNAFIPVRLKSAFNFLLSTLKTVRPSFRRLCRKEFSVSLLVALCVLRDKCVNKLFFRFGGCRAGHRSCAASEAGVYTPASLSCLDSSCRAFCCARYSAMARCFCSSVSSELATVSAAASSAFSLL